MFATLARSVPESAFAAFDSFAAANVTLPSSSFTTTSRVSGWVSVPSGPFTITSLGFTVTWTLSGTAMGYLAIRDMAAPLDDDAEHFAAEAGGTRLAVGHDALRRRHDRDPEPVHHAGDVVAVLVDAQPRARDALDLLDHRLAGVVLEPDFHHGLALEVAQGEVLDVALVLQDLGDGLLHLRCRHQNAHLFGGLRVADARQHVGDGVTHAHGYSLPAGLDHSGDLAAHGDLADLVACEAELAERAARAARHGAAVAQAHGRGVARQRLQLGAGLVLGLVGGLRVLEHRAQRLALLRVLLHGGAALRFAVDDGKLGH